MSGTVKAMADYRGVFVMPNGDGLTVFLATRGTPPKEAHVRPFTLHDEAATYAGELARTYGCSVIDCARAFGGEDAA